PGHALPAGGGFGLRDGQRLHPLRRRLRIRAGSGDWDLHRQAPRTRPGRPGGVDQPEVDRLRQRRGTRLTVAQAMTGFDAVAPAPFGALGLREAGGQVTEILFLPPGSALIPPTTAASR